MHDAGWWRSRLRLIRIFSLVFLILWGCVEENGGVSRLTLHIMVPGQKLSRFTSRVVIPGQTRQVETISLLRVEVSGAGIAGSMRVDCPIPGGSPPQCQVTVAPDSITIVIELTVPRGSGRTLVVTGFDQTGTVIQRGSTTVDLTETVQDVRVTITDVSVTFTLLTGSGGG